MKIALVGYGKMGKEIEKIAISRGHSIALKCNSKNPANKANFKNVDVAIEFSVPKTVLANLEVLIDKKIPTVVGTTGWNDNLENIKTKVKQNKAALVYASNFSIGVNLFFKVNQYLAKLMQEQNNYTATIEEIHHTQKLDAPSGTAISLAQDILKNNKNYTTSYCLENEEKAVENGLQIKAKRQPDVPGTHRIEYRSDIDTINISHVAHKRTGFALGAVVAAEWIVNQQGVYTMQDVLKTPLI